MACSSSSSSSSALMRSTRRNYYDVFVSFRGTDTRFNFTDHLFAALRRKGIVPFRDDTKLQKGDSITPALLRAIEGSQVFVAVFSKDYASSTWCLDELENILLHCAQVSGKRVLPVFYDVDPSEVRKQSGSYAEAFAKHEERFKHDLEKVCRWRKSLTQVANLSGWDLRDKPQYAEIEKIVEEIINKLGSKFSGLPKDLVGMDSPIEELETHLLLDSVDDVRVVGISGMGGIGKTTLATVLYGRISHQFDACCFIDDISKIFRHDGPIGAQKLILHQTLGEEHLQICNLYDATNLIQSRLCRRRALLILDNVDQVWQLEKLAVNRECLGAGSRIIIISRDEHVLKEYGVDVVYKVLLLNESHSLQLFCRKAFKLDNIMSSYEGLAYDVLGYAKGLPLAIKVLGSFLFGLDISEWRSALARLRENPNKDIMDVLRLSFDGLEEMEKEIFLHIACFFNGHLEKYVRNILNCCGFHADIGLRVLNDKSLIGIGGLVNMHDLLQELGRKIVQENSTEKPRKWSRLWLHEYFHNVVSENMEKNVEALALNIGWLREKEMEMEMEMWMVEALSKMSHLRMLILSKVNFLGSLNCISNELRYVEWHEYPFMYLPSIFQPNQLVELILEHSSIKQLWKGKKYLPNLKTLVLSHSKNIIKMPDFGEVPNLERLNLRGCVKLKHIDPSIGVLRKLAFLNLKDCKNLVSIPNNIFGLSSLKHLNLSGCSKVFSNAWHLKRLDTSESAIHSQSRSSILNWITFLPFRYLYPIPREHKDLLHSLASLSCLRELDISFCSLSQLPDAIGCLRGLEGLNLAGNNFVRVPSLGELSKLVYLNLQHCKQLESLPELPSPPTIKQDYYWWSPGMYIFDCPKLGERERCMTFSWMIQFIQANQESFCHVHRNQIKIVIPGSEIPSWFNNQSEGDLIRIDRSPIMHDNENYLFGIAFCVVFSVAPDDPTTETYSPERPTPYIHFNGNIRFGGWVTDLPVIDDRGLITDKSNHMCLIYWPRKTLFDNLRFRDENLSHLNNIEMEVSITDCGGLDVEVKNCGYRWVYKEDLQLMHQGNSFARKRKFLAIEDVAHNQNHSSD